MALFTVKYFSPTLCFGTDLNVIIPTPDADELLNEKDSTYFFSGVRFPVVYLLHGAFGDYSDWCRFTSVERYAQKYKVAVAMPSADNSFYQNMYCGSNYFTYVSEEVPAYVERLFPVSTEREQTCIAGLSMGGYGALHIGLAKPEKYGAIISLAGAIDIVNEIKRQRNQKNLPFCWTNIFKDPAHIENTDADIFYQLHMLQQNKKSIPKIFQSCGMQDFLYDMNKAGYARIKAMGIDITYEERNGIHDWEYWDAGLERALQWLSSKTAVSKGI